MARLGRARPQRQLLTRQAVAAAGDTNIAASVAALTLTALAATVAVDVDVAASTHALTLTEFGATVANDVNVVASVDALTLTEQAANIAVGVNVQATVDELTLTEFAASIANDVNVSAAVDSLTLTTFGATVTSPSESVGGHFIPHVDRKRRKSFEEFKERIEAALDEAIAKEFDPPIPDAPAPKVTKKRAQRITSRVVLEVVESGEFEGKLDALQVKISQLVNQGLARRRIERRTDLLNRQKELAIQRFAEEETIIAIIMLLEAE